jgi:GT2 family glycosyltransferase
MRPTVAVLITSFNRRRGTLKCLESLFGQAGLNQVFDLSVTLVDAGSSDGTADAVRESFPEVCVIDVPQDVFWGTGMRIAGSSDGARGRPYHLWLNDDVLLATDAVARLLSSSRANPRAIIVGQLHGEDGSASYGGFVRQRHPLQFARIGIREKDVECDTFNGNVVLVPSDVVASVGLIDQSLPHAMGDIDYGLRARAKGFRSVQLAGVVGYCETNRPGPNPATLSPIERLRITASVKRLPPRAWWTLCRRHAGVCAPVLFLKPYLDCVIPVSGRS